ncbi:MAG: zinc-binding alcohol dehydrogenase [Chloroflexaceae bacterium]|nr:zinc-binding alcohol dehydrogenase [Chloroflexaceae bacterium]
MKQLIQHINNGQMEVIDVPVPAVQPGYVLVQVAASLVSAGTERMLNDFARKNLLEKARSRPDLVHRIVQKAQQEGVLSAIDTVRSRLAQPVAPGYACAGTVLEVGRGVRGLQPGDAVACAGAGYAVHAQVVLLPQNLVVALPAAVDAESAAFTTMGAIALHGIRLAEIQLGETVAVIGLGVLGQLTVQMLKAAGCCVIGLDIQPQRANLALHMGADAVAATPAELVAQVQALSGNHGADAVIITADTSANGPIELAGEIARDRGVVVAVGAVGMDLPRRRYYQKELSLRISRSYGPGRYDPQYEEQGHDYPYAYVRWTEQRNMQAFVQLLAEQRVQVGPLISHRFAIDAAPAAYTLIDGSTGEPFLGVVLTYPPPAELHQRVDCRTMLSHDTQPSQRPAPHIQSVRLACWAPAAFPRARCYPSSISSRRSS